MIASNDDSWGMNAKLFVYTWYIEDEDAVKAVLAMDDLKKVGMDQSSCYSMDQCSICLEELFKGSKSECVMTECLHVFHKECIFQWFKRSLTCPLCRNDKIF
ncbi:anaphase-promoting complex subunit 11 RING-H2 finger protein [Medicago truncatula]|nr:anaphase-promoting complex subunit 11 RING-H2 finger protein [Medicago truncatula]